MFETKTGVNGRYIKGSIEMPRPQSGARHRGHVLLASITDEAASKPCWDAAELRLLAYELYQVAEMIDHLDDSTQQGGGQ